MSEQEAATTVSDEAKAAQGWAAPLPEVLPALTYTPAVFGLGLLFLGAGLATEWAIAIVGAVLVVIGAVGWIGELVEESSRGSAHGEP